MPSRGVYLGRIAGVEVFAQLSTLVIAGLLTWSFASGLLPASVPDRLPVVYWSVAIVGALLFLASLLGHELSHSVVARHNGVEVEGITLWLFGGVASLKGHAPGPGAEFRIAVAGPVASLVIAAVSAAGSAVVYLFDGPQAWVVMLGYLAVLNGFLAVFNLLPGAPLDGGRILGSILWKLRGDRASGMAGAAKAGTVVAGLIVAGGFAGDVVHGLLWRVVDGPHRRVPVQRCPRRGRLLRRGAGLERRSRIHGDGTSGAGDQHLVDSRRRSARPLRHEQSGRPCRSSTRLIRSVGCSQWIRFGRLRPNRG
ncbi:MAG: site-2 protease family protein [Microthrixaceae bacterium]|nr:site-2 protease family protein [Microthrixaceae bacterium]